MNSLIEEKIINLELQEQNIQVSEEDIQSKMQEVAEQYGGQEGLEEALQSYGYSLDDIKKDIQMYLNRVKLLEPEIVITDDEIKNYFEENKDSFSGAEYEDCTEQIKKDLFESKLSTTYDTWLQDKYSKYKIENFITE